MRLVLCTARVESSDAAEAALDTLLDRDLDWTAVSRHARENRVQPLVHRTLVRQGDPRVPAGVLDRLADASREIALANLRFDQTLQSLVGELEAASIPVIPFKGPTLARRAYGNSAYRQYVDLTSSCTARTSTGQRPSSSGRDTSRTARWTTRRRRNLWTRGWDTSS